MSTAAAASNDAGLLGLVHAIAGWTGAVAAAATWWLLSGALVAGLVCLAAWVRDAARRSHSDPIGFWIAAALFLGALLIRVLLPPWTHYTYNDEYQYLRFADELHSTGTFSLQNQPPLLIYLYAIAFSVLPTSGATTSAVTVVAGSLTAPALFGCLRRLGVDRIVATLSAVLLALHPLHVKHSGASSLEVMSLLFVVATVGTFARWRREPGLPALLSLATCLFAALTTRVENFALVPVLGGLAFAFGRGARRPGALELGALGLVVATAALYLPGVLGFHGEQADWWKSELGALALLRNNLGFWIGGALSVGKVPFLLLAAGLVGSWRTSREACVTWLALLATYSIIYVVHGVNLGYHPESAHAPYFAARAAGHDMFRFNVPLLPAIVFFTASGVVAWVRLVDAGLSRVPARARAAVTTAVVVGLGVVLLGIGGEYRAYDPVGFLRSPYNRPIESAAFHFLQDELADAPRPIHCFTAPSPIEPFLGDGIEMLPMENPGEVRADTPSTFLFADSGWLSSQAGEAAVAALRTRLALEPVASRRAGPVWLRLFRLSPGPVALRPIEPAGRSHTPHRSAGRKPPPPGAPRPLRCRERAGPRGRPRPGSRLPRRTKHPPSR